MKKIIKQINKIAEDYIKSGKKNILSQQEINCSIKSLKYFLRIIDRDYRKKFKKIIININDYKIFERFIRSILNFNYQHRKKSLPKSLKFIIICAAIESFFNFRTDDKKYNTKIFCKFFKKINSKNKDLIKEKFIIMNNKPYSPSDILNKFSRYIYEKRSKFLHQGIHFDFIGENCVGLGDLYEEEHKAIDFKMQFKKFLLIYIDGLCENLKFGIENDKK